MVQVLKFMSRFLIAAVVCAMIISGLMSFFVPNLVQRTNDILAQETTEVLLEEPEVVYLTVNVATGTDLFSALEKAAAENTTEQLDTGFWQSVRIEFGRVYAYKNENGRHVLQSFDGSEASDWVLVFTSSNASGARYKVKMSLLVA